MTKNEMKNRISLALKDPILQQGFEIICKENAELKEELEAIDKAGEHVRQQINDAFRNKRPYWELENENAQLKEANETLATMNNNMWVELEKKRAESQGITNRLHQLIKAKEIIKKFSEFVNNEIEYDPENPQEHTDLWNELCEEAEQFLREIKEND